MHIKISHASFFKLTCVGYSHFLEKEKSLFMLDGDMSKAYGNISSSSALMFLSRKRIVALVVETNQELLAKSS